MTNDEVQGAVNALLMALRAEGAKEQDIYQCFMASMVVMVVIKSKLDIDAAHDILSYTVSKDMLATVRNEIIDQLNKHEADESTVW